MSCRRRTLYWNSWIVPLISSYFSLFTLFSLCSFFSPRFSQLYLPIFLLHFSFLPKISSVIFVVLWFYQRIFFLLFFMDSVSSYLFENYNSSFIFSLQYSFFTLYLFYVVPIWTHKTVILIGDIAIMLRTSFLLLIN